MLSAASLRFGAVTGQKPHANAQWRHLSFMSPRSPSKLSLRTPWSVPYLSLTSGEPKFSRILVWLPRLFGRRLRWLLSMDSRCPGLLVEPMPRRSGRRSTAGAACRAYALNQNHLERVRSIDARREGRVRLTALKTSSIACRP